ncbi:MAG: SPFH domain-containing protein, partial [Brachybacterium sp.]|nr:SPFH domain-containing protein [Brachybacterium sp.]
MEGVIVALVVIVGVLILVAIVAALLFGGLRTSLMFTVHTQEAIIVERFGKFKRVAQAGLNFKTPFIDNTTRPVSLRVQQLEVNIESKTKDNV